MVSRSDSVALLSWRCLAGLFTTNGAGAITAVAAPNVHVGDAIFATDNLGPAAPQTVFHCPLPDGPDRRIRAVRAILRPSEFQDSESVGTSLTFARAAGLQLHVELRSSLRSNHTAAQLKVASNLSPSMIGQRFGPGDGWQHVDWAVPPAHGFLFAVCRSRARFVGGQLFNQAENQSLTDGLAGMWEVDVAALVDVPA